MAWLITGGAGYIGAHVVREFLADGESVVVVDDLSTGLAQRLPDSIPLYVGSVLDADLLDRIMTEHALLGVVHVAGKKSVPESIERPAYYEEQNVLATQVLLDACARHSVQHFVFSSSASVYGIIDSPDPIAEDAPTIPINPYGASKLDAERLVEKATANATIDAIAFRYFNVGGAASALFEDSIGQNLIPIVRRSIAAGVAVQVFGTTLPTRDGTCVRDYIDVRDLARAHLAAARYLECNPRGSYEVINLGTGHGSTVLEVIDAISRAEGVDVTWIPAPPRAGDPIASTCDASRANALLGWRPTHTLDDIVKRATA